MNFQTLRFALRQPASLFETYKAFNTTHPKQMNMWLLMSSMAIVLVGARGAERLICVDVEAAGDLAAEK